MTTISFIRHCFCAAPAVTTSLAVALVLAAGATTGSVAFHFAWFFFTLPAYLLNLGGVDVSFAGALGPPMVTGACCAVLDIALDRLN